MLIEGDTVIFKSTPTSYEREMSGEKSNTTRIIEAEEWDRLLGNLPRKIRVFSTIRSINHWFDRKVTNVMKLWQMFDKVVVTISWQHVTEEAQDEKSQNRKQEARE